MSNISKITSTRIQMDQKYFFTEYSLKNSYESCSFKHILKTDINYHEQQGMPNNKLPSEVVSS